jgi:hypothetical protein
MIKDVFIERALSLVCMVVGHFWTDGRDHVFGITYKWCKRCWRMTDIKHEQIEVRDESSI